MIEKNSRTAHYLMNGMTPLRGCRRKRWIWNLETDDYDTLNGFLISLIDKIPSEHDEVFDVKYGGYEFRGTFRWKIR